MKLHRYFAWRYLKTFMAVFALFSVMAVLIGMIDKFRDMRGTSAGFFDVVELTILDAPTAIYRILPLIGLLSSVALFMNFARTSEFVITRAAGRSALVSLAAPVVMALVLGMIAVAIMNPLVAATQKQYEVMVQRFETGEVSVVSLTSEGLWMRQGSPEGQTVIRATGANETGTELHGVTFLTFGPDGRPKTRIDAQSAVLEAGNWRAANAKIWDLGGQNSNPESNAQTAVEASLPSNLTPARIRESFATPSKIPIWDLPHFITRLESAGFSARVHQVWLQSELSLPLLLVAMVMIGAAFTMRHTRLGGTGLMVLMAIGMGFGTYFIRNFAQILGENGQLPVALSAWGAPTAAILLAFSLILHFEDG
ncbi:MAG: LPS export ABC transporter permease LptG [Deltaproteobacteria bacterium]